MPTGFICGGWGRSGVRNWPATGTDRPFGQGARGRRRHYSNGGAHAHTQDLAAYQHRVASPEDSEGAAGGGYTVSGATSLYRHRPARPDDSGDSGNGTGAATCYSTEIREYGYASHEGNPAQQSVEERSINHWKAEADRIFRDELDQRDTEARFSERRETPDATGGGRDGEASGREIEQSRPDGASGQGVGGQDNSRISLSIRAKPC